MPKTFRVDAAYDWTRSCCGERYDGDKQPRFEEAPRAARSHGQRGLHECQLKQKRRTSEAQEKHESAKRQEIAP